MNREWFVYMVECCDGSIYTGISVDVLRRVKAHNSGRGARYTRSRRPVTIRYISEPMAHGDALRREMQIKKLSRNRKLAMIKEYTGRDLNGCR